MDPITAFLSGAALMAVASIIIGRLTRAAEKYTYARFVDILEDDIELTEIMVPWIEDLGRNNPEVIEHSNLDVEYMKRKNADRRKEIERLRKFI